MNRDDLLAQAQEAARRGLLAQGGIAVEPTPPEELEDLMLAAQQYERSRARGDKTVPITIRIEPAMVDALREEADRLGARGYQTVLKQWIRERLAREEALQERRHRPQVTTEGLVAALASRLAADLGPKLIAEMRRQVRQALAHEGIALPARRIEPLLSLSQEGWEKLPSPAQSYDQPRREAKTVNVFETASSPEPIKVLTRS